MSPYLRQHRRGNARHQTASLGRPEKGIVTVPETTCPGVCRCSAKPRCLEEPVAVSRQDLSPRTHFYRYLEVKLDLSFVGEWTRELYAERGRPSIDPVIFFNLQLVMRFGGTHQVSPIGGGYGTGIVGEAIAGSGVRS